MYENILEYIISRLYYLYYNIYYSLEVHIIMLAIILFLVTGILCFLAIGIMYIIACCFLRTVMNIWVSYYKHPCLIPRKNKYKSYIYLWDSWNFFLPDIWCIYMFIIFALFFDCMFYRINLLLPLVCILHFCFTRKYRYSLYNPYGDYSCYQFGFDNNYLEDVRKIAINEDMAEKLCVHLFYYKDCNYELSDGDLLDYYYIEELTNTDTYEEFKISNFYKVSDFYCIFFLTLKYCDEFYYILLEEQFNDTDC